MKNLISQILLLLLFTSVFNGCAAIKTRNMAFEHYDAGVAHLNKGNVNSALKEFAEADKLYPGSPSILHSTGMAYHKKGELDLAVHYFKMAEELSSGNDMAAEGFSAVSDSLKIFIETTISEAALSQKAGRYAEAIANYKAVLMIKKGHKEATAGLQAAVKQMDELIEKKMSEGMKAFKENDYYPAKAAFGEVLQIDNRHAEARRMYKESSDKIDELVASWMKSGIDDFKRRDIDSAIVSFIKVLNIAPDNREARDYLKKVDMQKTMMLLEREITKYYLQGIEEYTDGRFAEAVEAWKKVLELDPTHEKALLNIEKARKKMKKTGN